MKNTELIHRFWWTIIDCLVLISIMSLWRIFVHVPKPPFNPYGRLEGLWLIFYGLYEIITGFMKMLSIANPLLMFVDRITELITHFQYPVVFWQYFLYYFMFEKFLGTTPGKKILGVKVVSKNNKKPTTMQIFIRTISRIIPLEPFSFVFKKDFSFWHDNLSKTKVVYKSGIQT